MTRPADEHLPKAKLLSENNPSTKASVEKPGAVPMGPQPLPSGKIVKPAPRVSESAPRFADVAPQPSYQRSVGRRKKQGSNGWVIALSIAGVFGVLLIGICGGAIYFAVGTMNQVKKTVDTAARNTPRVSPRPSRFPAPPVTVNRGSSGIDTQKAALAKLAGNDTYQQIAAIRYLAQNPSDDPAEKTAVAARMLPHLTSPHHRSDALTALKVWLTKENLTALTEMMREAKQRDDRPTQQAIVEVVADRGDVEMAPLLTDFMVADHNYRLARRAMGALPASASTERLLPHFHDDNRHLRDIARQVLAANKVADSVLIEQSIKDLSSGSSTRKRQAISWLANNAELAEEQQTAVAAAAATLFDDVNCRHEAVRAVKRWATSDNAADLLPGVNHPDYSVRTAVRTLTNEWNVKPAILLEQAAKDLRSDDKSRAQIAMDFVAREVQVDQDAQAAISKALAARLDTDELHTRHRVLDALAKWATADNVPMLITQLDDRDHGVRDRAAKILVQLKDPRAIAPLARGFGNPSTRYAVRSHLVSFGPLAEMALHPYLESEDWQVSSEAARILAQIGTARSIPPLLKVAQRDNRSHQGRAAEQAILEIRRAKRTVPEAVVATAPKEAPDPAAEAEPVRTPPRPAVDQTKLRTWTDTTGKHKIEAEFVELNGSKVKLKTIEGKHLTLSLKFLSQQDQDFIRDQAP